MTQELTVVKTSPIEPTKEDYLEMSVGEPKNMLEARAVAAYLSKSKFLPTSLRGDTATALMLVITCKQYNLPITALSEVMEVNGKIGFWGRTKLGIVLKSGVCEYIIPEEQTDKKCTLTTQRKGWPKPVTITYTIEQAQTAGLIQRSDAWKKHPADMLYWRAVSRIISQVYPDVIQGFATVEEAMDEDNNQLPQAQAVVMPEEMPKARKARKVKAVSLSGEEVLEDKDKGPVINDIKEVRKTQKKALEEMDKERSREIAEEEGYDYEEGFSFVKPEEKKVEEPEVIVPEGKTEMFDVEEPTTDKPAPKRYLRFIKQVLMEGGVRYVKAENPLLHSEDKWVVPSASMASALKKLTGMKVFLFVEDDKVVVNYEEYAG